MDNSSKIINMLFSGGTIQPCIKINRAAYAASTAHNAPFDLEMRFSYLSGVQPVVLQHTQRASSTTFVADLDAKWSQVRGDRVSTGGKEPNRGSLMTCTIIVTILDAAGNRRELSDLESTSITVT